ncbi:ribonuclease H-like domain-containing protein [Tanacetum coccineum]|uniref:Ribonuclease H-like domain-containing protein n=1 Tax=Tanacetum coccineum TaxID=301880 RepID=A0ABQ5G4C8_9ASTR
MATQQALYTAAVQNQSDLLGPVVKLATILDSNSVKPFLDIGLVHQLDDKNAIIHGSLQIQNTCTKPPVSGESAASRSSFLLQRSLLWLKQALVLGADTALTCFYILMILFWTASPDLYTADITSLHAEFSYRFGAHVCLFMHDPREPHLSALKRILRYVRGTLSYGLQLYSSTTSSLVAYSDADWAGCPTTRRSTSGYCVFLGNNLLSWSSKRQFTLSRSSAEAEYRGVANAVAETCWLRNLLRELHTPLATATLVYCDNVSAVYLSSNPVQHQRTKHIEIDIHFVRDLVATGAIRVLHVPSHYQYADIFTKGLLTSLFDEFRTSLSVWCPSAPTAGEWMQNWKLLKLFEQIHAMEEKLQNAYNKNAKLKVLDGKSSSFQPPRAVLDESTVDVYNKLVENFPDCESIMGHGMHRTSSEFWLEPFAFATNLHQYRGGGGGGAVEEDGGGGGGAVEEEGGLEHGNVLPLCDSINIEANNLPSEFIDDTPSVISEIAFVVKLKWFWSLSSFFVEGCSFMLCDLDFEPLSLSLSSLPSCDLVSLTNMLILLHYLKSFKSEFAEVFVFKS